MRIPNKNVWFTSDHHFGHENIIEYQNRPFMSIDEMDDTLVERWNNVVNEGSLVFHLGDFALGGIEEARGYWQRLNGSVRVLSVPSHHDRRWLSGGVCHSKSGKVVYLGALEVLEVDIGAPYKLPITLCHYPLAIWDRKHYGGLCLHGHSHGKYLGAGRILDVGVDCWNYTPIALDDVLFILLGRTYEEAS